MEKEVWCYIKVEIWCNEVWWSINGFIVVLKNSEVVIIFIKSYNIIVLVIVYINDGEVLVVVV